MTATLRTQRARSRQAQSGAKRVEVVLDAGLASALSAHCRLTDEKATAVVKNALRYWLNEEQNV